MSRVRHYLPSVFLGTLIAVLIAIPAAPAADQLPLATEAYLTPPKEILDAVLALRNDNQTLTNISPDGKKFLLRKTDGLPPLAPGPAMCSSRRNVFRRHRLSRAQSVRQ